MMQSSILQVYTIKKKTQAKLFKNLRTGSKIKCSIPIVEVGMTRRGSHAAYITIENLDTGETVRQSFNILPNLMKCFIFIELKE